MSDDPAESDMIAAEYVLGLLPGRQAGAVEALAQQDAGLRSRIAAWEARLDPLLDLVTPRAPPPALWRRLALATAARGGGVRRLRVWQSVSVVSMAVAAGLLLLLLRPVPVVPPALIAMAPGGAPSPAFLIAIEPDGRAVVQAANAQPPSGQSYELWALRPGASVPVSLGVLPVSGHRQIVFGLPAGTQLLVSQEPQGGSPTGAPTGPVVFSGRYSAS